MFSANTVCLPPINILNGFYSGLISLVSSFKLNHFFDNEWLSQVKELLCSVLADCTERMAFYELLSAYYSHVLLCHLCFELIFISEIAFLRILSE